MSYDAVVQSVVTMTEAEKLNLITIIVNSLKRGEPSYDVSRSEKQSNIERFLSLEWADSKSANEIVDEISLSRINSNRFLETNEIFG